jgi:hypothetical protein
VSEAQARDVDVWSGSSTNVDDLLDVHASEQDVLWFDP